MSSKTIVILVAIFVGVVGFSSYVTNFNYGNRAENGIKAEYTNMENILGQYSLKVSEAVQVTGLKTKDLTQVVESAMRGRYGADGSKSVMQWIQENYPGNITDELYSKVQQIIESGRNKFENSQTLFIDHKRQYETNLGYLWKGFWLGVAGYPKIDLDEYVIISSEHAVDAFEKKIDKGLKL